MTGSVEQVELTAVIPGLFWPDDPWTVGTLRACLGHELEAVASSEFWHDGEPDPVLDGELEFRFRDTHPLKATITHMDGVVAVPHPIFPQALEADRMEWRRRELSAAPWSSLIGSRLVSVRVLIKPDIGYGFRAGVCGFLFEFSKGGRVGYENRGESVRISFDPAGGGWSAWQVVGWMRFAPPFEG